MSAGKMHDDEVDIDVSLARRLVATQFPRWAGRDLVRVESHGTDNAIFRLGDDLAVRLPRRPNAALQSEKEQRWVPVLAPSLPLPVAVPVAGGVPGEGYPFVWSVCEWLDGEPAMPDRIDDRCLAATDLAAFILTLRSLDASAGPAPGLHNFRRGVPLAAREEWMRTALANLAGKLDTDRAEAAWEAALRVPVWDRPPVWIHGDLHPANLLATDGRLSGVIDFGGLGVGDPACDLMPAWTFFDAAAREVFRAAVGADDAMWERARGWVLSMSLIALPYYERTNPVLAADSVRWIDAVLEDWAF